MPLSRTQIWGLVGLVEAWVSLGGLCFFLPPASGLRWGALVCALGVLPARGFLKRVHRHPSTRSNVQKDIMKQLRNARLASAAIHCLRHLPDDVWVGHEPVASGIERSGHRACSLRVAQSIPPESWTCKNNTCPVMRHGKGKGPLRSIFIFFRSSASLALPQLW